MWSIARVRRSAVDTLLFILAFCSFTFGQTLTVLHTFNGSDGGQPSGLVRGSDGKLYGSTRVGGKFGCGTVFKITQAGKFTSLYSFLGGKDGCNPEASVIRDAAGNLYGTTAFGGRFNAGTVFKINSSGHESVLYAFTGGTDGRNPSASVIRDAKGNLYGATVGGGIRSCDTPTGGCGTVFKIDSVGNETVVYAFGSGINDGLFPSGGVIMDSSGNLYGTTDIGGDWIEGTVFKIDPSGKETILHSFGNSTDGQGPNSVSFGPGGILLGATRGGGDDGFGTVFTLDVQGNETILYSFLANGGRPDGDGPSGPVARDAAGNLYGVTGFGGAQDDGIVYRLDPSGTETILHDFGVGPDAGRTPLGRLYVSSQGVVYGTASQGGPGGENGTVFKITP